MVLRLRERSKHGATPSAPAAAPIAPATEASRPWVRVGLVALVVLAAVGLGVAPISSPDPQPAEAPATVFSAGRAMPHVEVIAERPHPAGSDAMAQVARYLEARLRGLGLETRVQVFRDGDLTIRNVIGRLSGTDSTGAVLFVSHPDSVPFGPGAGDNATGAAVLLELSRTLAAGPWPRNDIIFLFDDDEEGGHGPNDPPFGGGRAYAERHPWMKDVRLVVGMDTAAWGVPHVLQTSDDDGLIVRGYADGVDHPIAFGFGAALTDGEFETFPFKGRGLPAIELEDNYADPDQHTARDTVEKVEESSVQGMGDQALGLARAYGDMDLTDPAQGSRVFHTFPVLGVVHYPAAWSVPLAVLALLAYAMVALTAIRCHEVRARRLLAGTGWATALLIATVLLAALAAALYEAIWPNPNPNLEEYLLGSSLPFATGAVIAIATAFAFAYRALGRRIGHVALGLGFLALWLVFAVVFAAAVPAAAYVFEWPLLFACAAWLMLLRGRLTGALLAIPAAAATFLVAPVFVLGVLSDGVASLDSLAVSIALVAGLTAPALVRPSPGERAGVEPAI
jgi:Peptidase family M28